ncbi:hypothetical protein QWY31_10060 [Cytophagales bacterium LB-30]|uniref:Lipoprotein n=1 Tax=Shiella aurantiaca TaxID=3058365 RepID=A0ABT8F6G8_9BACT|nr:hypothetical protein [Shiella aurantiaca]MDN4165849.1 hypothetical protein [Shiella aurantiaca]
MKTAVRLLPLLVFLSCGKEENTLVPKEEAASITALATVRYYGSVAADGCGWVLALDSATLSAEEVPPIYLIDGNKVNITFKEKGTAPCGMNPNGLIDIHLLEIR